MKDKFKKDQKKDVKILSKSIGISKIGKKIILGGIGLLILGFFILTKTNPEGDNWASMLSPFLIIGGYITIAIGIIFPEKTEETVEKK